MNKALVLSKEIWQRRELLKSLVLRNLKIRYKGATLGFFWSLMDPLLVVLVYLLFIKLTRFQVDLPYLLTGVLIWQFLSLCVSDAYNAIVGNTVLVKKVYFPRVILPLATVIANLINFLLTLLILAGTLLLMGIHLEASQLILLPMVIFLEFIVCLGLALFVSSLMVYFRDTQHLLGIFLMAWFFMSPVIYPLDLVPERWLSLYLLNPMCIVLMGSRTLLLGTPFIWNGFAAVGAALSLLILGVGIWTFTKLEPCFADEL